MVIDFNRNFFFHIIWLKKKNSHIYNVYVIEMMNLVSVNLGPKQTNNELWRLEDPLIREIHFYFQLYYVQIENLGGCLLYTTTNQEYQQCKLRSLYTKKKFANTLYVI